MTDYRAAWRRERLRRARAEACVADRDRLLRNLGHLVTGGRPAAALTGLPARARSVAAEIRWRWGRDVEHVARLLDDVARRADAEDP